MSNSNQFVKSNECNAPWKLLGKGLILVLKKSSLGEATFGFESYPDYGGLTGRTRFLMVIDYQDAPCGPYQELLLIPGKLDFEGEQRWSISDIWVSTQDSAEGGRVNWGIPKQLGEFIRLKSDLVTEDGWSKRISDAQGNLLLELTCQPMGPSLPFSSKWLPQSFLRMGQRLQGKQYFYDLVGNGKSRIAKVVSIGQTGGVFEGLGRSDVLAALFVDPFEMVLPVPEVKVL